MTRLERIVAACGGVLMDNGRRAVIAGPGHSPTDRSVSLLETEDGRILIHCFSPRDDWRAVRDALAARGLLIVRAGSYDPHASPPPQIVVQPHTEDRAARARRLWDNASPVRWTAAEIYLRSRAIRSGAGDALRFHPLATSLDDRMRRPALLAAITDAGVELQGVQVTLLNTNGATKAAVPTPRRIIGALMGGAVRLGAPGDTLIIAEGVETALSASEALGHPAWAALSAANLARFIPPASVSRLVIASDNDAAGRRAAEALLHRVADRFDVTINSPPNGCNDWNDWARASAPKA